MFTKLLKPVMALLRWQGVRAIIFLDNMLIMGQSQEELLGQVREILQLLELLGFVINQEKSVLIPSRDTVSRVQGGLNPNDDFPPSRESGWHCQSLPGSTEAGDPHCSGPIQADWTDVSHNAGCAPSTIMLLKPAEAKELFL